MVLQLEDVVDCLRVLHPNYDIVFIMDHSCGHDRQRMDGLNASNTSKEWGGKQARLRSTSIKEAEGYLGQYPRKLNVGDTQSMIFTEEDVGPFYLSDEDRTQFRLSREDDSYVTRKLTKVELQSELQRHGDMRTGNFEKITTVLYREVYSNIPTRKESHRGMARCIKRQVTSVV